MTPKEKAIELIEKYKLLDYNSNLSIEKSKQCALIAVSEIFKHIEYIFKELEKDNLPNRFTDEIEYWECVEQEIEKL